MSGTVSTSASALSSSRFWFQTIEPVTADQPSRQSVFLPSNCAASSSGSLEKMTLRNPDSGLKRSNLNRSPAAPLRRTIS